MMVARLSTVWMSVLCETRSSCFVSYADIRNFSSRRKEKKKKKKEEERNFSNITINITNIYVYINVFRLIKPVVKRYRIIPMSVWQFHRCPLIGCRKAGNQWFAVNRIYYIYIHVYVYIPQLYYEIPLPCYCDVMYTVTKSRVIQIFPFFPSKTEEETDWTMKWSKWPFSY